MFKGAQQMMREDRIQMLYFEIIFSDMYKDLPGFDTVYRYLSENRFRLVSFYRFHFQNNLASWTDALFINPQFRQGAGGHG